MPKNITSLKFQPAFCQTGYCGYMNRVQLYSSTLASAQYHSRRRWLDLEFQSGEVYRYFQVPAECYQELLDAESKGRYFNQNIRNRFAHQHLSRRLSPVVLAPKMSDIGQE
jgi:hypothetical protein